MSEFLTRFKAKYPDYAKYPDKVLVPRLAAKYPAYLAKDPGFADEYRRSQESDRMRAQIKENIAQPQPTTGSVMRDSFLDFAEQYGRDSQEEMAAVKEMSAAPPDLPPWVFQDPRLATVAPEESAALSRGTARLVNAAISPESGLIGAAALAAPEVVLPIMAAQGAAALGSSAGAMAAAADAGDPSGVLEQLPEAAGSAAMIAPGVVSGAGTAVRSIRGRAVPPVIADVVPVKADQIARANLTPGKEALSLPAMLRRANEITLAEIPTLPQPEVNLPKNVSLDQLRPSGSLVPAELLDAARRYRALTEQRGQELGQPGKLPPGEEAVFKADMPVWGAEEMLSERRDPVEFRDRIVDVPDSPELLTAEAKLADQLQRRDFLGVADALGKMPTEVSVKLLDELTGVGRKRVPLDAASRIIFDQIWEAELAKRIGGPARADVAEAVAKVGEEKLPEGVLTPEEKAAAMEDLAAATGEAPVKPRKAKPSSQALGIAPGAAEFEAIRAKIAPVLKAFWDKYLPRNPGDPYPVVFAENTVAPDFQPYKISDSLANRPNGLGRIKGLGWLFDPRYFDKGPVDRAIKTWAFERHGVGEATAASLAHQLNGTLDHVFDIGGKGGSEILNVVRKNPDAPLHISDFFEQIQKDPSVYELTPDQAAVVRQVSVIQKQIAKLRDQYKLIPEDQESGYFPRHRLFTPEEKAEYGKRAGGGGGPGAKQTFQKSRTFLTEALGAENGVSYEPSIEKRLVTHLRETYRAIADKRLAENLTDVGETVKERRTAYEQQFSEQLAAGTITPESIQQLAETPRPGEGRVNAPAFAGKIYPKEVADMLNSRVVSNIGSARKAIAWANAAMKGVAFGLDFSAPALQGHALLSYRPDIWAKATLEHYKAFVDPHTLGKAIATPENRRAVSELAQLGNSLGGLADYITGMKSGGAAGELPGLGPLMQRFSHSFETFSAIAQVEMWKAWRDVTPPEQHPALAETIQNLLMHGRTQEIGITANQAFLERVLLFAPSFIRGAAGLIASTGSKGVSGTIARRAILGWAGAGSAAMVGFGLAAGLSWDEIGQRLNPENSNWMTTPVRFSDGRVRNIGIGGPLKSIFRLVASIEKDIRKGDAGKLVSLGGNNPVIHWMRGKLAPVPSIAWDWTTGTDFLGEDQTMLGSIASHLVPSTLQQIWQRPGEPPATAGDLMPSFLGMNIWPEPVAADFQRQRDKAAETRGFHSYEAAPFSDQFAISQELMRKPQFSVPKEPTAASKAHVARMEQERIEKLETAMPAEIRTQLAKHHLHLQPQDGSLTFGKGVRLPLTRNQVDSYGTILANSYKETLAQVPWHDMENLDRQTQVTMFNAFVGAAKQRAKSALMISMGAGQ